MRGGHLDPGIGVQMVGCKVNFFGSTHAKIQHINAHIGQPARYGFLQRLAGFAAIATNNHGLERHALRNSCADVVSDAFVQLISKFAANVVGFKTGKRPHIYP